MSSTGSSELWIDANLTCTPLTEADRERIRTGIQNCYRASDLPRHDHVVWVRSPAELASTVAAARSLIRGWRRQRALRVRMLAWLLAIGGWMAWIGVRVLAVLASLAVPPAIGWIVLSRMKTVDSEPFGGPNVLPVVFAVAITMFYLGGVVTVWAWRSTIEGIEDAWDRRFDVIQPRFMLQTRDLLAPGTGGAVDSRVDSGVDSRAAESAVTALTPIWNSLWLAPLLPAASPAVRRPVACAMPARSMVGWIAYRLLTVICEPPLEVHTERVGDTVRLHNAAGPAVVWGDVAGSRDYYLHGVRVPEHLHRADVSAEELHREQNSEVRRVVIEHLGWPEYIERAGLQLVASAPDPGNTGRELRLYDLPSALRDAKRLLLMVNGSPDHSGQQRKYAELVPQAFDDPIAAAAWQYDCPVEVYRQLARRT